MTPGVFTEADVRRLCGEIGLSEKDSDTVLEAFGEGRLRLDQEFAPERLADYIDDPELFVEEVLAAIPDGWQRKVLRKAATNPRIAMKACKGPGKSTVLAWIVLWFLVTRVNCNIVCLSITGDNLRDGLWKELARWYAKSPALQKYFEFTATRITSRESPDTWWVSARRFARTADANEQAATLAGLHAEAVMVVLDEVSDYPPGVMPAAQAIFATEGQDAHLVVAGNPTKKEGPLWDICTRDAANWWTISITGHPDHPDRAPRISRDWALEQIRTWGIDNAYVKTNVLGEFPDVQTNKLLGPEDIIRAEGRNVVERMVQDQPRVMGVDIARKGGARSVLYMRQGPAVWRPEVWRGKRTDELIDLIAAMIVKHDPDAVFIDMGSIGAAVVDGLRRLGFQQVIGIDFAGKASKSQFLNKRAEIWWDCSHAVKDFLALPPGSAVLQAELTAPEFEYREVQGRTCFVLESKEDLEDRGIESPDEADALCLTFSRPVQKRARNPLHRSHGARAAAEQDYQPSIG